MPFSLQSSWNPGRRDAGNCPQGKEKQKEKQDRSPEVTMTGYPDQIVVPLK
jgi:hypothetical protein